MAIICCRTSPVSGPGGGPGGGRRGAGRGGAGRCGRGGESIGCWARQAQREIRPAWSAHKGAAANPRHPRAARARPEPHPSPSPPANRRQPEAEFRPRTRPAVSASQLLPPGPLRPAHGHAPNGPFQRPRTRLRVAEATALRTFNHLFPLAYLRLPHLLRARIPA